MKRISRYLIIADFEYTGWAEPDKEIWKKNSWYREIIQIGAVCFDMQEKCVIRRLNLMVRPKVNPILSDFILNIVPFSQSEVDQAECDFPQALSVFMDFCENDALRVLCYNADESVFKENLSLHDMDNPFKKPWLKLLPSLPALGVSPDAKTCSGRLHLETAQPLALDNAHDAAFDAESMATFLSDRLEKKIITPADILDFHDGEPVPNPRKFA